jgi:hypothetical protein
MRCAVCWLPVIVIVAPLIATWCDDAKSITSPVQLDGSPATIGDLVTQCAEATGVPLNCDAAVAAVKVRVVGAGPTSELLQTLQVATGGEWRATGGKWVLVGPLARLPVRVLMARCGPKVAAVTAPYGWRPRRWEEDQARALCQELTAGVAREQLPVKWTWAALSEPQRARLQDLCTEQFACRTLRALTWSMWRDIGPWALEARISWQPNGGDFTQVRARIPDLCDYTWWKLGTPAPAFGPNEDKGCLESRVTASLPNATVADVAARLCPPTRFIVMPADIPTDRHDFSVVDKTVPECLGQLGQWKVPSAFANLGCAVVGEQPLGALLRAQAFPLAPGPIQRLREDVCIAIVQDAPSEARTALCGQRSDTNAWEHAAFADALAALTDAQRADLAAKGSISLSQLPADKAWRVYLALDAHWRLTRTGEVYGQRGWLDFEHLSGEATSEKLTISVPDLDKPWVLKLPPANAPH